MAIELELERVQKLVEEVAGEKADVVNKVNEVEDQLKEVEDQLKEVADLLKEVADQLKKADAEKTLNLLLETRTLLLKRQSPLLEMRAGLQTQLAGLQTQLAGLQTQLAELLKEKNRLAQAQGLTPREFLASPLPGATIAGILSPSTASGVVHKWAPDTLLEWTNLGDVGKGLSTVVDAIKEHQAKADSIYSTASRFQLGSGPITLGKGEVSVVVNFTAAVLEHLNTLVKALDPPGVRAPVWEHEAPLYHQLQEDLLATGIADVISLQPSLDAPLMKSSSGRVSRVSRPRDVGDPVGAQQRSHPLKADFALAFGSAEPLPNIDGSGQATTGEQPGNVEASSGDERQAKRPRYVCVGEAKRIQQLLDMKTVQMAPIELLAAWNDKRHEHHKHAQAVISQVFTYLQVARACYGFITCYMATWLVWCSPCERCKLFITAPFLSKPGYEMAAGGSAATVKGAMAWLQYVALDNANVPVAPYPGGGPGAASSRDGNRDSTGGGGGGSEDDEDNEDDQLPDCGGPTNSDSSYRTEETTRRSARGKQQRQRETTMQAPSGLPAHPRLELHRRLCDGSLGLVVVGAVGGTPAVFKLLGPDDEGLDAHEAEVQAYNALEELQGKVVPDMLAAGRTASGVHYIAVSHLPGKPLSEVVRPLPPDVAQAAVAALQQVHSARTGFLHGDVRLQNIMLLPLGSSEEPARCMVIDFGQARLDGTDQEQGMEMMELERLLQ